MAVTNDNFTGFEMAANFALNAVVAISGIQAGQRVPGDALGQLAAQLADRPLGGFGRDMDVFTGREEHLARCRTIVDLPAPLGPSTLTNTPRSWLEKGWSFIVARFRALTP